MVTLLLLGLLGPAYQESDFRACREFYRPPNVRLQPRWLRIAPAAAGCKPMLAGRSNERVTRRTLAGARMYEAFRGAARVRQSRVDACRVPRPRTPAAAALSGVGQIARRRAVWSMCHGPSQPGTTLSQMTTSGRCPSACFRRAASSSACRSNKPNLGDGPRENQISLFLSIRLTLQMSRAPR